MKAFLLQIACHNNLLMVIKLVEYLKKTYVDLRKKTVEKQ